MKITLISFQEEHVRKTFFIKISKLYLFYFILIRYVRVNTVAIFYEGKGKLPENQHIWDVSPLLCFQNNLSLKSVFKVCLTEFTEY